MAKKRKTKREKQLSDKRTQSLPSSLPIAQSTQPLRYTFPAQQTTTIQPKPVEIRKSDYQYIAADLRRTALLSSIAIGAQVVLFFVLRR